MRAASGTVFHQMYIFSFSLSICLACADGGSGGNGSTDDSLNGNGMNGGDSSFAGGSNNGNGTTNVEGQNCQTIQAVVRDFRGKDENSGHPDFQAYTGDGPTLGLVNAMLDGDNKPTYTGLVVDSDNRQITSSASFAQWYRDVPNVNQRFTIELPLTDGVFDDQTFFPITGQGFGDRLVNGQNNNFPFTTEISTRFTYEASKNLVFTFIGDDDLWIFVNGRLALDLGGLHPAETGTIDFNAKAAELGLVDGSTYDMRIFHAERRTDKSTFRVQTNIQCFVNGLI